MVRSLALALLLLVSAGAVATADVAPRGPSWGKHRGLTLEAGLGIGAFRGTSDIVTRASQQSLAGPNLGAGWFVHRRLAVGVRVAGVYHRANTGQYLTATFAGPTAQLWLAPYAWVSAGAGLGVVKEIKTATGFALDARIGLTFNPASRHNVNVALEVNPVFTLGTTFTGLSLVAGYQFQ